MLATPRAGRLKILGGYIHKTREREWGVLFWTRADSQRGHHQAQNWGAALEKKREKRRLLSTSGENTHANFSPHHFIFNWGTIGGFFEKKKIETLRWLRSGREALASGKSVRRASAATQSRSKHVTSSKLSREGEGGDYGVGGGWGNKMVGDVYMDVLYICHSVCYSIKRRSKWLRNRFFPSPHYWETNVERYLQRKCGMPSSSNQIQWITHTTTHTPSL